MEVYTVGFAKRSAHDFFEALRAARIRRLLDVRLNNSSQLSGFTKRADLPYFLKELCDAEYTHVPMLAPTQELLDDYKKRRAPWREYEARFIALLEERNVAHKLSRVLFVEPVVLLCSERTAEHCHRRLVAEHLRERWGDLAIAHL